MEGKKSVDVGVSLCYCNSDLCNQVRRDNNNDWQDDDDVDHIAVMNLIHISITGHK